MTFAEWLKSFLKYAPRSSYIKIRKTYLLKNRNDINLYFIYYIILMIGKYLEKIELKKGEYHLYLKNNEDIEKILIFLKYNINTQFKLLMDICGIDNLEKKKKRFEINYNLLSVKY